MNDDEFPRDAFEAGGWHCAVHGQRTYNGVAILSRAPLGRVSAGLGDGVADRVVYRRGSGGAGRYTGGTGLGGRPGGWRLLRRRRVDERGG